LVAAGLADAPMVVVTAGVKGETKYRSIYALARYRIKEGAATPICQVVHDAIEEVPVARVPQNRVRFAGQEGRTEDSGIRVSAAGSGA
jgi:hypothetical protein